MLHHRIKAVREALGIKQTVIAKQMDITQQGYSSFECGQADSNMLTVRRFCSAVGIKVYFLVSDIPINEKTIKKYGRCELGSIIERLETAEDQVDTYEETFKALKAA